LNSGVAAAAEVLAGAAVAHAGVGQMLALFVALVLSAGGVALSAHPSASGVTSARWGAAAYLAAFALALGVVSPGTTASWTLLGYVAAVCVLLPRPLGWLVLLAVVGLHVLLTWISRVKAGLTGLPVTVLDIQIALANPSGLWDALGLPQWTRYPTTVVLALGVLSMPVAVLQAGRRLALRGARIRPGDGLRVAVVCVLGLMIHLHMEAVYADVASDRSTWQPEYVAHVADRIGVLPFLAYSYRLESQSTGDIYGSDGDSSPPSAEELRDAVLRYMDLGSGADSSTRQLPNILVVLAESTLDPGAVFRLKGEWNDELFRRGEQTAASGLLRVNAVGGGTWITEFETIVGLDSRLFGYSGMYTHASLSPFVTQSIATYLRDHGYRTWAFFPHLGNFYNARNAYASYGFEKIFDSADLGKGDWLEKDVEMAASVAATIGGEPKQPFFGYVLLLENHAPHECRTGDASSFPALFADTEDFVPNCALDEYLRRLGSTAAAVRSLIEYLGGIEARTGRPFVLLVFGDHQPHTFASTGGFQYDYGALRKIADKRTTFFHFISSVPGRRLRCCSVVPSAVMLPTLLSGFVAKSADDVYLGTNLWLHARCGADAVQVDFGNFMEIMDSRSIDRRTEDCRHAYERALNWYRHSDVVRLGSEFDAARD
jgi:hypothetical protein